MTSRKRGGRRSGTFSTPQSTPATGIATPPALHEALVDMGTQIESFAKEVRELKGLVRQLGGGVAQTNVANRAAESTLDIDVEGFKRARRQRIALLCAAVMVPVMLIAAWGLWPAARREGTHNNRVAAKEAAPPPVALPAPAPVLAVPAPVAPAETPAPQDPLPVRPKPEPRSPRPAPMPAVAPAEVPVFRPPPAQVMAHETSGGAPILD